MKTSTKRAVKLTAKVKAFVPPPARPDEDIPSIDRTIGTIGAHVLADAIDAYEHARHRAAVIWDRVGAGEDRWTQITEDMRDTASTNVVKALILWFHPKLYEKTYSPGWLKMRFPDCGVAYRGRVYAVAAAPDSAHLPVGDTDGCIVTGLAVIDLPPGQTANPDLSALTDLDAFFGWNTKE